MEVRVLGGEFSDMKAEKEWMEGRERKERNVLDFKPIRCYNRR